MGKKSKRRGIKKTADAAMVKKEEDAMGEASVDDICIGDLYIGGKCELDKEVSYLGLFCLCIQYHYQKVY